MKDRYLKTLVVLFGTVSLLLIACGDDDTSDVAADTGLDAEVETVVVGDCPDHTPAGLGACVDQERIEIDLEFIAAPRPPGSDHWMAVQDLCAERFEADGYTVERQAYDTGVNVIGTIIGSTLPDEQVIVSAHYDGVADCDGADDNGSGVAGLLETARVLSDVEHDRTLKVACWDEEELGLWGSKAYVERAVEDGDQMVMSFVFETMGYCSHEPNTQVMPAGFDLIFTDVAESLAANDWRGDFLTVVASDNAAAASTALDLYGEIFGLPVEILELDESLRSNPMLGTLHRSDHSAFWGAGVPAMMLTDSAEYRNQHYHCRDGEDDMETIDFEFTTNIVRTTVAAATEALME